MKIYKKHIVNNFVKLLLIVSIVFFILVLLINLFEELNFFKDTDESLYYPLLLNFLNSPSILINIFPFIFLISAQFLLINLIEKNELIILKNFGIDNFKLIYIISLVSFIASLFIIVFFYNFSAKLKFFYLDIKNDFASDNKYLAVITDNGIWIKDEIDNKKTIINANLIEGDILKTLNLFLRRKRKICLLHLDLDVYEATKYVLEKLFPLIVKNGIILMDDYNHIPNTTRAIDEFIKMNRNLKINKFTFPCRPSYIIKN